MIVASKESLNAIIVENSDTLTEIVGPNVKGKKEIEIVESARETDRQTATETEKERHTYT